MPVASLIGLPYDASSSFQRGPAEAPAKIREALWSDVGNTFTEDLLDLAAPGVLEDAGDLAVPASGEARALIESGIAALLARTVRPLALGGDHSVTYPVLRAMHRAHPTLTVLHIDAHPDLYDALNGDRYSHACPFARSLEDGLITRLVQVGIRTANAHQAEQAARFGVETIDMRAWSRGVRPTLDGPLYISLDLDGLDPAFAPGVSHHEPGGLSVRDVLTLIQTSGGTLVGADVVELNPRNDINGMTARVAAKCVKELVARMVRDAAGLRK